jgi:hypothetical protein
MAERGRGKKARIDLIELEKLAMLQCTDQEIAAWFGVAVKTIERRRSEPRFAEVMERGKAKGRISVRRQQMKLLEDGNATMGVWLGKNLLGQVDHVSVSSAMAPNMYIMMPIPAGFEPSNQSTGDGILTIDVSSPRDATWQIRERLGAGESIDSSSPAKEAERRLRMADDLKASCGS